MSSSSKDSSGISSFEVEQQPSLGPARDRRLVKSWSAGSERREVVMPLRPSNYSCPASGTEAEAEMNESKTFGGISRAVRPTLPSIEEQNQLQSFLAEYTMQAKRSGKKQKTPRIVAFVNSKSGGQVGALLMRILKENLSKDEDESVLHGHVCDLSASGEPTASIDDLAEAIRRGQDLRLMVCGGDGTVTWILTALEQCRALKGKLHRVPVGIVPLGTGNDLARSLGWGPKLSKVADILSYLKWIVQAVPVQLDQWRIVLRPHNLLPTNHKLKTMGSHPQLVKDPELSQQLFGDMNEALEENCTGPHDVYLGMADLH
jgi:hypothetical protein